MEGHAELLLDLGREAMRSVEWTPTSNGFSRRSTAEPIRPAPTVPTCIPSRSYERDTASGCSSRHRSHWARAGSRHEDENQHDHVLGDADAVAVRDLGDGDPAIDRRLEIDVIRADPRRDRELQVGRDGEALRRQVRGPEGLGDHDLGLGSSPRRPSRDRPCRRRRPTSAALLEKAPEAELAGHAPSRSPGVKYALGRRSGLAVGRVLDRRDPLAA